jgi:hypothetical protein
MNTTGAPGVLLLEAMTRHDSGDSGLPPTTGLEMQR